MYDPIKTVQCNLTTEEAPDCDLSPVAHDQVVSDMSPRQTSQTSQIGNPLIHHSSPKYEHLFFSSYSSSSLSHRFCCHQPCAHEGTFACVDSLWAFWELPVDFTVVALASFSFVGCGLLVVGSIFVRHSLLLSNLRDNQIRNPDLSLL